MKYLSVFEKFNSREIDIIYDWVKKHGNQRIHLSKDEINQISSMEQNSGSLKPTGFWYGIGVDWLRFCLTDLTDRIKNGNHAYRIDIDRSKILVIVEMKDLFYLIDNYSVGVGRLSRIDWNLVSKDYSGVEFPTYKKLGLKNLESILSEPIIYNMLNVIDVPSGCIWDSSCVKKITKIV